MIEFAKSIRQVFEKNKDTIDLPFLYGFPSNSCEAVSTYFAFLAMKEFPQASVEVVHGWNKDDEHHYWVKIDGLVYDITADQFPNVSQAYYGLSTNPLLSTFTKTENKAASVAMVDYDGVEKERKDNVYQQLASLIKVAQGQT